jgi:hypothetical protein
MGANYGYGQMSHAGTICTAYALTDPGSYSSQPAKICHSQLLRNNELVSHILGSMDKEGSKGESAGSIDEIFEDRLVVIRSKMELILLQLNQRRRIHQKILYEIDRDSCKTQNLISDMGLRAYRIDRDRITIERMQLDLDRQKRMEKVSYFTDTSLLNRELRDALIEYLEEVQRSALIKDMKDRP